MMSTDTSWETVYAAKSVPHVMTGHAYSRALVAHLSTTASLMSDLLSSTDALKGVDISDLKRLLESDGDSQDHTVVTVDGQLVAFSTHVQEVLDEAAGRSCGYSISSWLACIAEMIPIFNSAGHFAYAKCTCLYFQQMGKLKQVMPEAEFKMFAEKGMFVARTDHFYGVNFMDQLIEQCLMRLLKVNGGITLGRGITDQLIEQCLMRLLKVNGGITLGRGITDSTMAKFTDALPKCIPICAALEVFALV